MMRSLTSPNERSRFGPAPSFMNQNRVDDVTPEAQPSGVRQFLSVMQVIEIILFTYDEGHSARIAIRGSTWIARSAGETAAEKHINNSAPAAAR